MRGIIESVIGSLIIIFVFEPYKLVQGVNSMDAILAGKIFAAFLIIIYISRVAWWYGIKDFINKESKRQSKQISGKWQATEKFHTGNKGDDDTLTMQIKCNGGVVNGKLLCTDGYDKGSNFNIKGTYKDQILNLTWTPQKKFSIDSGTLTLKLYQDDFLSGHGVWLSSDQKLYTSKFEANRIKQ